jgi:hypothetical protein
MRKVLTLGLILASSLLLSACYSGELPADISNEPDFAIFAENAETRPGENEYHVDIRTLNKNYRPDHIDEVPLHYNVVIETVKGPVEFARAENVSVNPASQEDVEVDLDWYNVACNASIEATVEINPTGVRTVYDSILAFDEERQETINGETYNFDPFRDGTSVGVTTENNTYFNVGVGEEFGLPGLNGTYVMNGQEAFDFTLMEKKDKVFDPVEESERDNNEEEFDGVVKCQNTSIQTPSFAIQGPTEVSFNDTANFSVSTSSSVSQVDWSFINDEGEGIVFDERLGSSANYRFDVRGEWEVIARGEFSQYTGDGLTVRENLYNDTFVTVE